MLIKSEYSFIFVGGRGRGILRMKDVSNLENTLFYRYTFLELFCFCFEHDIDVQHFVIIYAI